MEKKINELKNRLHPNGFLLLTQTNFRGFMPTILKQNWYAWVPEEHFTHFSLKGLKYIGKATSLSMIDYKYSR
ncbi:MAG: hypothetical protein ACK55I_41590, partial [bacterium]